MKRVGLLGVLLIGLLSVTLLQPAISLAAPVCETVTVLATDDPKDTNIDVEIGDEITYEATGTWRNDPTLSFYNADGFTGPAFGVYMPGEKVGKLIGRVDSEDYFVIGVSASGESAYTGRLYLVMNDGPGAFGNNAGSLSVEVCIERETGGGGLTRPLADADEHPTWEMYDYDYVHTLDEDFLEEGSYVYAHSNEFGASVAAVADGTVVSITPFTPDKCFSTLFGLSNVNYTLCIDVIPAIINGSSTNFVFNLEMVGNYVVTIEDASIPGRLYEYIVSEPTVAEGDFVVAGCVIGKTIQLKSLPVPDFVVGLLNIGMTLGLSFTTPPTNAGVTYIGMADVEDGLFDPLLPSLVLPPDLSNCKEQALSGCVNDDSSLIRLDRYYYDSGVTLISGGGVTLPVDKRLYQTEIMIDPLLDYTLNVQARIVSAGGDDELGRLRLIIGQVAGVQRADFDVTGGWQNFSLTTTGTSWIYNTNLTDIGVYNGGSLTLSSDIEIRYMCLAPVTASTAPGSCYFANNEFDYDASGWIINGTTFASGQAFMLDGSYITQVVRLLPDEGGPHNYTIRAVARLLATSAYTGQVGKEVVLQYEYPQGDTPTDVGVIDSAAVIANGLSPVTGAVLLEYPYELTVNLEITEETQENFLFRVEVTDPDNYILGLRLDSVCIDPEGDGTFPGQDPGGGYDPPVIRGCSVVPVPIEGSVAAWTFYHWSNLKRFFNCELMPLLKNWFKVFDGFRVTMLKVGRYWIALVHHGSNWTVSVFYWFNGHFSNIAQGRITTVFSSGNGCNGDILCNIGGIIDTLANTLRPIVESLANAVNTLVSVIAGVFIGVVNLFFTLIGGLVSVVVAIIIRLMRFVQSIVGLLTGLVGAFNGATPTAIPGLPTCATDPSSNLLCMGVWFADNTIFSGRWNTIFIIIYSIWSILLILYIIGEIKDTLLKTWGSS